MTTALELIQEAYKIIGIYSEERPLEGERAHEGLINLNKFLDRLATRNEYISFNNKLEFNLIVGQRSYEISNNVTADVTSNRLISLKSCSLKEGSFSYPVTLKSDSDYYKTVIEENTKRRPVCCFLQNNIGKSELTFFVKPDQAYPCTLIGRFVLNTFSHITDEITNVPLYFIDFLEISLARILHSKYPGSKWDELDEKRYLEIKSDSTQASDTPDMTIRRIAYYGNNILSYF